MPLAPQFFPKKYLHVLVFLITSFSEKIILIDKIPAFLQAFEHVISMFMTAQSGIWVELTSDVTLGTRQKHSRDF